MATRVKKEKRPTVMLALGEIKAEIAPENALPGFWEEMATVTAADGEYRIGRCAANTALHIFRPNGKRRVVIGMSDLLHAVMDEVFRLEREGAL